MPAGQGDRLRHRHPRAADRARARACRPARTSRLHGRQHRPRADARATRRRRSPDFVDGRSFAAILHDPTVDPHPRQRVSARALAAVDGRDDGIRGRTSPATSTSRRAEKSIPVAGFDFIPGYRGVRTEHYMYAEYSSTSRELYVTDTDPTRCFNLASDPRYGRLVAELHGAREPSPKRCRARNVPQRSRTPRSAVLDRQSRRDSESGEWLSRRGRGRARLGGPVGDDTGEPGRGVVPRRSAWTSSVWYPT